MKIGTRDIGYRYSTFVIAEACSNITRWLDGAALETFVKSVASTGADSLKIQLFTPASFPLQEQDAKRRVMFPRSRVEELSDLCHEYKLLWGASVFDDEAVELCHGLGADFLKLATREFNNSPLIAKCLESGLPIIRSYDWTLGTFIPSKTNILHMACVPQYPAHNPRIPVVDYHLDWGWSSHSEDVRSLDCLLAVSRHACVIERHFKMSDMDYEAGWSLDASDFRKMIWDIRAVEQMR